MLQIQQPMMQNSFSKLSRPQSNSGEKSALTELEFVLHEYFRLNQFRHGQKEIIQSVLEQKDTLAVLPTGGGKSLCYQLPAVYTQKLVVVISPLIALMKDQVENLKQKGINAGCLYSEQSLTEKKQIFQDIQKGGAYILYLSPERIQKEGFALWFKKQDIALCAIDEAHCVSQWGHDFRQEYSQLSLLKKLRPEIPLLTLTASATPLVIADIIQQLDLKNPQKMIHGFYRSNLYYQVEFCEDDDEKMQWLKQAMSQIQDGRIIIYCGTRKMTEEVHQLLHRQFDKTGYYHAGLAMGERNLIQEQFIKGEIRILIATNAFGMGVDQANVRLVVHYNMPANIDALYQEMGRAGRDGLFSTCLLLYSKKDKGLQSFFIRQSESSDEFKSLKWKNLDALMSYIESSECRNAEILTYFKDAQRIQRCGHCDNCNPHATYRILEDTNSGLKYKTQPDQKTPSLKNNFNFSDQGTLKAIKKSKVSINLNQEQEVTFERLRQWRKSKAAELDIPAFMILGDKSLREIAYHHPLNLIDLRKVFGLGPQKIEQFGKDILLVLENEIAP